MHLSEDVSGFAAARLDRLRGALAGRGVDVETHPGVTVVPPGTNRPSSGGHWKVFTPYQKRWLAETWRPVLPAPERLEIPGDLDPGEIPTLDDLVGAIGAVGHAPAPGLLRGGEREATERLRIWAAAIAAGLRGPSRRPGRRRHLAHLGRPALRMPVAPRGRDTAAGP